MNQKLTAMPGTISQVQSSEAVGGVNNTSTQLAQATTAKSQGQVKAATTVVIPASKFGSVTQTRPGVFEAYCMCFIPTYSLSPALITSTGANPEWHSWVLFPLNAVPLGQTIIGGALRYGVLARDICRSTAISAYGQYRINPGMSDPSLHSPQAQFVNSSGSGQYGQGNCETLIEVPLTENNFLMDINAAKTAVNRFSLALHALPHTAGSQALASWISENFRLTLTYGILQADLKVNGSDGPITVAGGSNLNLSWNYSGYDGCIMQSSPAWYTPGWPIGQNLPATTGSTGTRIYYESVTYAISCRNAVTGVIKNDSVQVNVTP